MLGTTSRASISCNRLGGNRKFSFLNRLDNATLAWWTSRRLKPCTTRSARKRSPGVRRLFAARLACRRPRPIAPSGILCSSRLGLGLKDTTPIGKKEQLPQPPRLSVLSTSSSEYTNEKLRDISRFDYLSSSGHHGRMPRRRIR